MPQISEQLTTSEEDGGMTTQPVHSVTADADVLLPADGLRLLGHHGGRRFLVGRGDGEVFQLSLLPYLIMAAIAEGGVDGGWSADQVGARVATASGQRLTAEAVRSVVAGTLAPLGLIAPGGAERRDPAPGAARPPRVMLSGPIVGRVERLLRPYRGRRWALALGASAVLVSVAAAAPIMAETGNGKTGGTRSGPAAAQSPAAASAAAAASRSQAAAWVAQQVSPDVTVSCDPGLCGLLRADGFPAARLRPLALSGRAAPLGSGVVVETPAIRRLFGPPLAAAYAPQVIASFGSGAARVDVRTIAPAGATAFRAQVAVERTALAAAGRQLLGNKDIQASPSARAALRAGLVDARLLTLLSLLCAQRPIRLVAFTGAPGSGSAAPLRGADIGVASSAARSAVLALLDAQQSPYRPAAATAVDGGGGRLVVAVRFDAPAALNLSQP
jgi:hypothetical protein